MANIIETIENGKMKRFCSCCQTDFTTISMWGSFRYCPYCGSPLDHGTIQQWRCGKCIYETTCQEKYVVNCNKYKRDPQDGGYYG